MLLYVEFDPNGPGVSQAAINSGKFTNANWLPAIAGVVSASVRGDVSLASGGLSSKLFSVGVQALR